MDAMVAMDGGASSVAESPARSPARGGAAERSEAVGELEHSVASFPLAACPRPLPTLPP